MKNEQFKFSGLPSAVEQRGVVLFIALIVLVAMSLAGIGLMRSVGNGVIVAGNMGMKRATTAAGEHGLRAAEAAIDLMSDVERQNNQGASYFASNDPLFDPVMAGPAFWLASGNVVGVVGTPYEGMDVRYVVHRLCETAGPVTSSCIRMGSAQNKRNDCVQGGVRLPCDTLNYAGYRITVRVVGPKNSVSYVQVMLF